MTCLALAEAQIVAYKAAPASQQPTVLSAGNGVPLINIQTPSAAGVSRNTYEQFDVQTQGVILNNSRTNVATQLGGWVQGNPWLATGSARVILNEVVSGNPSQLLGYVEVAGSAAQVVIANPAGVTCNGCGFINASRATLTTGTPIVSGGNLEGYRVEGGTIRIEGAGMDASRVGYTDLIARAVEVNAGLWAQTLKVTAGSNVVSADHTQATPIPPGDLLRGIAGSGAAPAFAIDVAQLGGMYAGKITLVGTEAGVGVRNAGTLGASAGEVVVTADGRLTNSGSISSTGQTQINVSGGLTNTGTVYAKADLALNTPAAIDNTQGTIAADGNLDIRSVGLDNTQGTIGSALGSVSVDTGGGALNNRSGMILAALDVSLKANGLNNTDGYIVGRDVGIDTQRQAFDNTRGSLVADGSLDVQSGALTNAAGLIQAVAAMTIDTHGEALTNTLSGASNGIVGQGTVSLTTGSLDNTSGFIGAKDQLSIAATDINNSTGGALTSEHDIVVVGTRLDNHGGQIQALGTIDVQVNGAANNAGGLIRAGQALTLTADSVDNRNTQGVDQGIEGLSAAINARQIDNTTGAMRADQTLALTSGGSIDNSDGLISSAQRLQILDPNATPGSNAGSKTLAVTNTVGTLIADQQLTVDAASLTGDGTVLSRGDLSVKLLSDFSQSGQFAANGNATLETAGTLTNRARMQAGNSLTLKAASISNETAGEIVGATVSLTATDSHTLTNRGLIDGQDTFIDSPTVNNLGTGRIYGDHIAIAATTLNNEAETVNGVTSAPVIAARTRLDIGATTLNNRDEALLFSAGDIAIGGSLDANHRATGQANTLNNISASIEALGDLSINVGTLNNKRSAFSTERQLDPTKSYATSWTTCDPGCDYVFYNTDQVTVYKDVVTSTSPAATIRAGGNLALSATNLTNEYSSIAAGGNLDLVGSTLTNLGVELFEQTDIIHSGYYRHWGRDPKGFWTSASSSSVLIGSASAVISAGGNLTGSFTDRIDNVTLRENTAPVVAPSGTAISALSVGSVTQVAAGSGAAGATIRTATPNTTLPGNSLFHTNPNPGGSYLIETDPRFANYRTWLSSDYLLQQLALDPATTQKRLGDGFYEQRLITEQVGQLTGRRFLTGFQNEEDQYRALMDAGVAYAQAHQLRPGAALSAEQMAALTTDIVWLVEKSVSLADGSTQKVLVPQVYARLQAGDLAPSGALLAGGNVDFKAGGDLLNSGRIAGRQVVSLSAENIKNLGGQIGGDAIGLSARNDLINLGGRIEAGSLLLANAGRDLTVASSTVDLAFSQNGKTNNTVKQTVLDRVAGLYVTGAGGMLLASAGRDLALTGAVVQNQAADSTTLLSAGRNLTLGTVGESSQAVATGKKGRWSETTRREVGSVIETGGDLTLSAKHDLTARAASVTSDKGALIATAGNDLKIEAGQASYDMTSDRKSSKRGMFSSSSTTRHDEVHSTSAIASTFSGDSVTLTAGRDIAVKGSNVVATKDTTLTATRNLTIEAATETHSEIHTRSTKQSGVFSSGGAGVTLGSKQLSTDQKTDATTAVKSTIGSLEGNVILSAGQTYRQVGSDVIAPKGDIDIKAKTVDILEARETSQTTTETKSKQSGLTLAITSPVITALQTAQQMSEAAGNTKDGRMQALAAANVGLTTKNAADAVAADPGQMGGVNLSISIGGSKSSSKSTQTSNTAVASNLTAGGDINIEASGGGSSSNLTIQGSQLTAGNNVTLHAEDEIKLLAAANSATQNSNNQSSSGSVGISMGTSGLAITASASQGQGKANGNDLTWSNTQVEAGNQLTLESGGNTTLRGATAKGEQVVANVGGNLLIESLQDTSTYDSKQRSAGFSISVPVGPGMVSGSISASGSRIDSTYASVGEQSAIKAGDGGFQVAVTGNTDLKAGAITSTQAAVDGNKNRFHTDGALTLSDLQNKADYNATSASVNLGTGFSAAGALVPQGTSAGFGKDSGSASSTTQAAISGVAGNQNARTGDRETGIKPIFDQQQVQQEIDAQVKITQMFGQLASTAVGDYAQTKLTEAQTLRNQAGDGNDPRAQELRAQAAEIEGQWGADGTLRLAAHTLIGGLTGGVSGAAGAAAGTLTAPLVAGALKDAGIDGALATTLTGLASTAAGAVVGGATGAGTALNEVANNYLSHSQIDRKRQELADCKSVAECKSIADKWNAIDRQQTVEAQICLANGSCGSVMMNTDVIREIRDELKETCAAFCSADALASLKELNGYFLPNGDVNQDALRTGQVDWGKLTKAGINFAGAIAGAGTGAIMTVAGGALVLAPEPTGVSKSAGALTAATGVATLADSSYGIYSNAVNLYRATEGSVVYLPDSGSGKLADWLAPGSQNAQDVAQIGSLSLAFLSGRVYVGTTLRYGDSAFAQYMPATINGMLDTAAATPTGALKQVLIPNTNPGKSIASWFLDTTQLLQAGSTNIDNSVRLINVIQGEQKQ